MLPLQMNTVTAEIKPSWITEKEKLKMSGNLRGPGTAEGFTGTQGLSGHSAFAE